MTVRRWVTLPPQRAAYGVTARGHAVLRVIRWLVSVVCLSMVVAMALGIVLAWALDWKM